MVLPTNRVECFSNIKHEKEDRYLSFVESICKILDIKKVIMYAPPLYKCTLDMVTDICMNFLKSSVILIRCGQIDLDEVLEGILVTRDSLPLQYLGLPLSVWSLRRRDFQHLEDKCAEKLPTCNGKFIAMVGRVSLVKLVIATQAIYHLTPLSIPSRT
jgi:hypothetical protein